MLYKLLYFGNKLGKMKIPFIVGIINKLIRFTYSCDIPCSLDLDASVRFAHKGLGVCINNDSIIGKSVFIHQHVTIGKRKDGGNCPVIGNNVIIGAGAIILGNITIGSNVKIGAGAIVVDDVPNNSVVIPEKSRIILD